MTSNLKELSIPLLFMVSTGKTWNVGLMASNKEEVSITLNDCCKRSVTDTVSSLLNLLFFPTESPVSQGCTRNSCGSWPAGRSYMFTYQSGDRSMAASNIRRAAIGTSFAPEMVWLQVGWSLKDSQVCGVSNWPESWSK